MRHITFGAALTVAIAMTTGPALVAQTRMTPATPGTPGDPVWQGKVRMSDGRVFVTDGGFAFDSALAKLRTLPEREFPSKLLEDYLKTPHKDEWGLSDLKVALSGKTYSTPSGLALSATYINYLRRVLPA